MLKLSTDDLRLVAERLLEDCDPKKYDLDDLYIVDLRDAILEMVNKIEQTGEFIIDVSNDRLLKKEDKEDGTSDGKDKPGKETPTDEQPDKKNDKKVDDERKTDKT